MATPLHHVHLELEREGQCLLEAHITTSLTQGHRTAYLCYM